MENINFDVLDILCLHIKPGMIKAFDRAYRELSLPMLQRWNVEVIAFGPSLDEEDAYLVVRRYKSLADRKQSQDAFYGSDEWKLGPRKTILSLVEDYTSVAIPASDELIAGFRRMHNLAEWKRE
jgi:hypothetical protein